MSNCIVYGPWKKWFIIIDGNHISNNGSTCKTHEYNSYREAVGILKRFYHIKNRIIFTKNFYIYTVERKK